MTTLDLDALERAARALLAHEESGRLATPDTARVAAYFRERTKPEPILSLISDHRALQERVEGAEKARPQTWGEWERAQQEKERGA